MTLRSGARYFLLAASLVFSQLVSLNEASAQLPVDVQGDASEVSVAVDGTATHRGSGFIFQNQIGDAPLRGLTVYGPSDVSAYYTLHGGGNGDAWITFYVYPASNSLADEVGNVEGPLLEQLVGRRIESPSAAPPSLGDARVAWFEGRYKDIPARTGYYLVKRGDWFLKARFTIPNRGGSEAMDRALRALAALQWDWKPSGDAKGRAKVATR